MFRRNLCLSLVSILWPLRVDLYLSSLILKTHLAIKIFLFFICFNPGFVFVSPSPLEYLPSIYLNFFHSLTSYLSQTPYCFASLSLYIYFFFHQGFIFLFSSMVPLHVGYLLFLPCPLYYCFPCFLFLLSLFTFSSFQQSLLKITSRALIIFLLCLFHRRYPRVKQLIIVYFFFLFIYLFLHMAEFLTVDVATEDL